MYVLEKHRRPPLKRAERDRFRRRLTPIPGCNRLRFDHTLRIAAAALRERRDLERDADEPRSLLPRRAIDPFQQDESVGRIRPQFGFTDRCASACASLILRRHRMNSLKLASALGGWLKPAKLSEQQSRRKRERIGNASDRPEVVFGRVARERLHQHPGPIGLKRAMDMSCGSDGIAKIVQHVKACHQGRDPLQGNLLPWPPQTGRSRHR